MRPVALPQLAGVEHRDVQLGDVRLHVAQAGSGPPLLLLHGWPQHWWSWRRLIGPLAERYTVIVPDLRGFGWSDAPPGAYDKRTFVRDVIALLDHDGHGQVRVIGHDWGAYTTFLLALEHPERVERAVALDIVPPWALPPRPQLLAAPLFLSYQAVLASPLGVPALTRGEGFVRSLIRAGSGPGMRWSEAELHAYAGVLREGARARASSACYRTFLSREMLRSGHRSGELSLPMLLLMGGRSALRAIFRPAPGPNLAVEVIVGAGHFLPEEAPDAVLEHVNAFFGAGPASA